MRLSFRAPRAEEERGGRERLRSGPGGCMDSSAGGTDANRRCPRLAADWEEHASALSPAEGFLLSRMDGHTPWAVLREIGGLTPGDADAALAAWVEAGLVLLDPEEPAPEPAAAAGAVDPALDLEVELQREILAFEARLGGAPQHQL